MSNELNFIWPVSIKIVKNHHPECDVDPETNLYKREFRPGENIFVCSDCIGESFSKKQTKKVDIKIGVTTPSLETQVHYLGTPDLKSLARMITRELEHRGEI